MKKKDEPAGLLRNRCLEHFKTLGIPLPAETLDGALERATRDSLPHLQFLDLLLGPAAATRRERGAERRIRAAKFRERRTLEAFDWKFNPKINRLQIEELATLDFIRRGANLILIGQAGVGKSHIVQALGMRACAAGFNVLYRTSAKLLAELTASLADKTLTQCLRGYARPDLLVIDEFAFDLIERAESPQAAHLLYKVIVERHHRRSIALVSNIDFDRWADYLGDAPLAMALLDRLVQGATIIKITGKSYRARSVVLSPDTHVPTSHGQP